MPFETQTALLVVVASQVLKPRREPFFRGAQNQLIFGKHRQLIL